MDKLIICGNKADKLARRMYNNGSTPLEIYDAMAAKLGKRANMPPEYERALKFILEIESAKVAAYNGYTDEYTKGQKNLTL